MNLTNKIKFMIDDTELNIAIKCALKKTCNHIFTLSFPEQDILSYDINQITANNRNPHSKLSFLRFFLGSENNYDRDWVEKVHHNLTSYDRRYIYDNGKTILNSLDIYTTPEPPKNMAFIAIRDLHIFLIALWAAKAIQLPMYFQLPQTVKNRKNNQKQTYRIDSAYDLYPPILKLTRRPYQSEIEDKATPNIMEFIPPLSQSTFKYLAWRPILASSWSDISDITIEELRELFAFIYTKRHSNEIYMAHNLSPVAWLRPYLEFNPMLCKFSLEEIKNLSKSIPSTSLKDNQLFHSRYQRQRHAWSRWIDDYRRMLLETGRVKTLRPINRSLSLLLKYIFENLAQSGITPPCPDEVLRCHIDGYGATEPLRTVITHNIDISNIRAFFDYVETISATGNGNFRTPLTRYDKRFEPRPTKTNKKTFEFNDFRFFFALSYSLLNFIQYLLEKCIQDPENSWQAQLRAMGNNELVLETSKVGFVPLVSYIDIQGSRHTFPLHWIPYPLLAMEYVPLKNFKSSRYVRIPTPDALVTIITALETSIRFVHIRWLDKKLFQHSEVNANDYFFDLYVNTDKSGTPWVRGTSVRVLHALNLVTGYKQHIHRSHYDTPLKYTNHLQTHYPLIIPIFCTNHKSTVISEASYRGYFKELFYYFNQLKIMAHQPALCSLPVENVDFSQGDHFRQAVYLRRLFKSDHTPHGLRATVISLSSTFLTQDHIGEKISGHRSRSNINRYCVINKQLLNDVKELNEGMMINSLLLANTVHPTISPLSPDQLLHNAFSVQAPDGHILSNDEILERQHMLTVFSTHFCLAGGRCPDDIIKSIGKRRCGQCYLGLRSIDHIPAILALIRKLGADLDRIRSRLKYCAAKDKSAPEAVLLEEQFSDLVNEYSAWTLTADHMMKNTRHIRGRFFAIEQDHRTMYLAEMPTEHALVDILTRINDTATYPELTNSSLKADVFRLSAKLISLDKSFESLFSIENENTLYSEFRGKIHGIILATNLTLAELDSRLMEKPMLPPNLLPENLLGRSDG
ncbi:hypothetical protein [Pseudomonas koreensis]|uniref:hypothetical protein n=1 Tax=Pseudomonas koreensis TaxID=198620 RepID=UPI003207C83B